MKWKKTGPSCERATNLQEQYLILLPMVSLLNMMQVGSQGFFSRFVGQSTHGAKNGGSFSEMMGPSIKPLKKEDQLSLNAGQKYCRMLQGEHSAILSTYFKLPFVIKIFVLSFEWLLKTGFTVLNTYMNFLFCGVRRLLKMNIFIKVRFFKNLKGWVHWAHCLGK